MKILEHFQTDNDGLRSPSQERLEGVSRGEIEDHLDDDLRRKYPSARKARSENEIAPKYDAESKSRKGGGKFMDYLRDMFNLKSTNDTYRLERDEDGYVKKLYSERDDFHPKPKQGTDLLSYVNDFLGATPHVSGDGEKTGNFARKTEKLLAKLFSQHGNEWFQDMDDLNNERGGTQLQQGQEVTRRGLSSDSIKRIDFSDNRMEKLLAKIVVQHGDEWFQDLDGDGDSTLLEGQQAESQLNFLHEIFAVENKWEFRNENKFKDQRRPEQIKGFLTHTDYQDRGNETTERIHERPKAQDDKLIAVDYLRKLFGTKSTIVGEDVEIPRTKNETEGDARVQDYLTAKSKNDIPSSLNEINQFSVNFQQESEEAVSIAYDFEGDEDPGIDEDEEEEEEEDWEVDEDIRIACINDDKNQKVSPIQADESTPSTGLINCAIGVAKIFTHSTHEGDVLRSQLLEDSASDVKQSNAELSGDCDEDVFEEALSETGHYNDEEYSLPSPTNQDASETDVAEPQKQGSPFHKIRDAGYKYFFPQSSSGTLLQQCRQFLGSPSIHAPTHIEFNQSKAQRPELDVKNEDVFEDARDFMSSNCEKTTNELPKHSNELSKTEIRFLVRGQDSPQITIVGKNEEEVINLQDVLWDFEEELRRETGSKETRLLTIAAPEIFGLSEAVAVKDMELEEGIRQTNLDLTPRNIPNKARVDIEECLGKNPPKKNNIRFFALETNPDGQDVSKDRNEPETEDNPHDLQNVLRQDAIQIPN